MTRRKGSTSLPIRCMRRSAAATYAPLVTGSIVGVGHGGRWLLNGARRRQRVPSEDSLGAAVAAMNLVESILEDTFGTRRRRVYAAGTPTPRASPRTAPAPP